MKKNLKKCVDQISYIDDVTRIITIHGSFDTNERFICRPPENAKIFDSEISDQEWREYLDKKEEENCKEFNSYKIFCDCFEAKHVIKVLDCDSKEYKSIMLEFAKKCL